MSKKRSLYCCLQAKVKEDRIYCAKGHPFSASAKGRETIPVLKLVQGDPLELTVCQKCPDYFELGPPVEKADRGWVATLAEAGD